MGRFIITAFVLGFIIGWLVGISGTDIDPSMLGKGYQDNGHPQRHAVTSVIQDYGFPTVAVFFLAYFIYFLWKFITTEITPKLASTSADTDQVS